MQQCPKDCIRLGKQTLKFYCINMIHLQSLLPGLPHSSLWPGGAVVKNPPVMQETQVWSLGWKDPLGKEMSTHSSILAWKIPWTEQPGELHSKGSQRVGHDWATEHARLISYTVWKIFVKWELVEIYHNPMPCYSYYLKNNTLSICFLVCLT